MGNAQWKSTSVAHAPSHWRRQLHRGWIDAQNGGWASDYERMNKSEQIAYEQGRLLLREAMAEGFAIPPWRGDKAAARTMDELWSEVHQKLGRRIVPEEWVPPALGIAA